MKYMTLRTILYICPSSHSLECFARTRRPAQNCRSLSDARNKTTTIRIHPICAARHLAFTSLGAFHPHHAALGVSLSLVLSL